MKALTLWQPWATLVAIGAKRIETRDWATDYRGPLAIHAAARKPEAASPEIADALRSAGYCSGDPSGFDRLILKPLPLGCVVAVARLERCVPTNALGVLLSAARECAPDFDPEFEFPFGNFSPDRFGWLLSNVTLPPAPIPAGGRQKLWDWEPPAGVSWKSLQATRGGA